MRHAEAYLVIAVAAFLTQTESPREQPCASAPPAGSRCTVSGIEFAAVPAGTFAMGDASPAAAAIEQPVHDLGFSGMLRRGPGTPSTRRKRR